MNISEYQEFKSKIIESVSKVMVGKEEVIELVAISYLCGGHVLLEDIPGVGKTMLAKAFAKTIGKEFKRIQFTPDLLPSDLTGINFYNQKTYEFEFKSGPLFSNLILADEINRATPRTQSSLLEAMEEKQVTVDGLTRKLSDSFMVLATENPVESFGTFPLPEAQLDRFFMRVSMGYPSRRDEIEVVNRNRNQNSLEQLECVITQEELAKLKAGYQEVKMSEELMDYLMDIIEATRTHERISLGVSPRGTIALVKASRVYAAFQGRDYVIPEDVKKMAPYLLNHRLILKGMNNNKNIYEFIETLLNSIKVPVENILR